MTALTRSEENLFCDAVWDRADGEVRASYSGRGMYGEECAAFTCGSLREAVLVLLLIAQDSPELAERLGEALHTDSMGTAMIVYFPGITIKGESEDDDDI